MTTADDAALVAVDRLKKSFGEREVFDSFNLVCRAGERVGLVGPNGSGKTTLLRCIAGSLAPDGGSIEVGGEPAGSIAANRRVGISLAQDRSFYMRLTGHQNLLFFAALRVGRRAAATVTDRVVKELDLEDVAVRRVDRCSTGMIQRLALARSLLGNPEVILLDEATRSLDDAATTRLWEVLESKAESVVLLATHLHDDVSHLTRVVALGN